MTYKLLMILGTALIITGCATHEPRDRPDWIDGSSSRYPREQYIIGRGQAEKLSLAQDLARSNIAKTFEVRVQETSSDSQQVRQTADELGVRSSQDSRIRRQISTATDQLIDGIEIAEVWQAPDSGQYYTLAILSRHQAIARLRRSIAEQDNATEKFISASRASQDPLTQAGFAARALTAQRQRADYQKMATIVDLNGRGVTPRWETARLQADLDGLFTRIRILPVSTPLDDEGENILPLLTAALAAAGLTPGTEDNSDYTLAGQIDITDLGPHDGWNWQRATVQIQLTDRDSGQLRGTRSWNTLKAAGLDSATARQRLLDKVEQTLKQDLRQTLIDMALAQ